LERKKINQKALSQMIKFKSQKEVEMITKNTQRVIVIYETDVYDVTNFLPDHPGSLFFNAPSIFFFQ